MNTLDNHLDYHLKKSSWLCWLFKSRRDFLTSQFRNYQATLKPQDKITLVGFEQYLWKNTFFPFLMPGQKQGIRNYVNIRNVQISAPHGAGSVRSSGHTARSSTGNSASTVVQQQHRKSAGKGPTEQRSRSGSSPVRGLSKQQQAQKQNPSPTAGQKQGAAKTPKRQGGGGPALQKDPIKHLISNFLKKTDTFLTSFDRDRNKMTQSHNQEVVKLMMWLERAPGWLHRVEEDDDIDDIRDLLRTYNLNNLFDECIKLDKQISDADQDQVSKYESMYKQYKDRIKALKDTMDNEQLMQLLRYNTGKKWSFPNFQQQGEADSNVVNVPEDLKVYFTRDPSRKHGHLNERYIVNRNDIKDQITVGGHPYNITKTRDKITFSSEDQPTISTHKCMRDPNDYLSLADFCRLLRTPIHFPRSDEPFVWTRLTNCVNDRFLENVRFMVNLTSTFLYHLPSCYKLNAMDDTTRRDRKGTIINSFEELVQWFTTTDRTKYRLAFVCPTIRKSRTILPSVDEKTIAVYTDKDGVKTISLPIFKINVLDYKELMYIN